VTPSRPQTAEAADGGGLVSDRASRFVVAHARGPRDETLAVRVFAQTKRRSAGQPLLRCSDGWRPYPEQLRRASRQEVVARTGLPVGRAGETLLGYVELHGSFAFSNLLGGAPFTYQAASEVFDAQTGNLLMYGGLQAPTPTPTVLTATPTATPTPVVKFEVQPTSFDQSCGPTSSPLPALSVTLDNTGSTIAVSWSIRISDQDPNHTAVWASASPTTGTTPAGGTTHVTITPAPDLCARFGSSSTPVAFHVTVTWTTGGGGTATITDTVHPYIIG
jgi:hypothetical protein